METPRQNRFAGAAPAGDHHTPQAGVNGCQEQGQFQGSVAGDGGKGEGPSGCTTCNHGNAGEVRRGRQSR